MRCRRLCSVRALVMGVFVAAIAAVPVGVAAEPGGMGVVVESHPVSIPSIPTGAAFSAWQVRYVSQTTQGAPLTTLATILRPVNRIEPPVLLAYDAIIDALAPQCFPSYQMQAGLGTQLTTGVMGMDMVYLAEALQRGWTVVVPDYLGPDGEFAAGYVEGRTTLDAIRAAENFPPAGLSGPATPTAIFGYSGGARGSEFAAELAADYAPELNLRGVAAGGVTVDIASTARAIDGTFSGPIAAAAALGIGRAYPELSMESYFPDAGFRNTVGNSCLLQLEAAYPMMRLSDHTVTPGGVSLLDIPQIAAVVGTLRAGTYGTPSMPLYIYHAMNDETAPLPDTDALIGDYCARGVNVTYHRLPGVEHLTGNVAGSPAALEWIGQRLTGAPAGSTCGMPGQAIIG
ncbi:lipase family protein [Nocardia concava]|uniref:lipase family protein n=1 Tax=Nocardia concava TaxID=257281 RepID=UPI0012F8E2A1|nr:lipase family protein [Nocardia concava]